MNIIREKPFLPIGVGILGAGVAYTVWKMRSRETVPTEWKEVGVLSDMMCFPIKSCGVVRLPSMECAEMGLKLGRLRDRNFCFVNEQNNFVSARIHPKLLLVQPSVDGDTLTLTAPDMEPLKININQINQRAISKVTLWEKPIKTIDCGDEVARWISKYILEKESGLRMVYFPPEYNNKWNKSRLSDIVNDKNSGGFPDLTSFNMINESSIEELNTRLNDLNVDPQRFRPNFVVKGPAAFDEDNWKWVKIGDVVFKNVKQCTRCILTTIDWKTGIKNDKQEPLATLKTYRMVSTYKKDKSPVMGIHLIVQNPGQVNLGDKISVAY